MNTQLSRWMLLLCAALLILPATAHATKYTADFLTVGTGARPLAMGGAFTAVGEDNNALFFNPGALAAMGGNSLSLMHSERFGGLVQVDNAGYHRAVNLYGRQASLGISVLRLGVDNITFTNDHPFNDLNGNGEFDGPEELPDSIDPSYFSKESDQEWGILGIYATQAGGWSIGGGIKIIYQSVGSFNSFGFGLDAGLLSPPLGHGLRAGLKIQDITGTYVAWNTGVSEFVAPSLRPGLAWRHALGSLNASVLLAGDLEIRFEEYGDAATWSSSFASVDPHLGGELWLLGTVALRLGLDRDNWTAGGGLRLAGRDGILPWNVFDDLSLDYGFGSHEVFDGSHRLGLSTRF